MKSETLQATSIYIGRSDSPTGYSAAYHSGTPVDLEIYLPGYRELPEAAQLGDALILPNPVPVIPTRRLIVIVPPEEIDEDALVRRVWQLVANSPLEVLYLSLEPDDLYAAYQRRRLARMSSLTTSKEVRARTGMSTEKSWLRALLKLIRPGDLLVCLADYKIIDHYIWRRKLSEILAESTTVPVYLLAGLQVGSAIHQRQWFRDFVAWTASFVLIAIFFVLQVQTERMTTGSISTILLSMSVFIEIFLLYKINDWIG